MRRFPNTTAAFAFALATLIAAMFWHIDVFDIPNLSLIGIERSELGEVAIAILTAIPAAFLDRLRTRERAHEERLRAEQVRVVHVTMRTVQDIVNNNLNQLLLLRFEADGHVSPDTLKLFDEVLADTTARLTAIASVDVFAEKPMAVGPGLDVPAPLPTTA